MLVSRTDFHTLSYYAKFHVSRAHYSQNTQRVPLRIPEKFQTFKFNLNIVDHPTVNT